MPDWLTDAAITTTLLGLGVWLLKRTVQHGLEQWGRNHQAELDERLRGLEHQHQRRMAASRDSAEAADAWRSTVATKTPEFSKALDALGRAAVDVRHAQPSDREATERAFRHFDEALGRYLSALGEMRAFLPRRVVEAADKYGSKAEAAERAMRFHGETQMPDPVSGDQPQHGYSDFLRFAVEFLDEMPPLKKIIEEGLREIVMPRTRLDRDSRGNPAGL